MPVVRCLQHHLTSMFILIAFGCFLTSKPAFAAPPHVSASIKPVQALVKMVMGSLGTPDLIVPATASPHLFTLKPSQAKMLENANVVFWIGPSLETTLQGPLEALADDARIVTLLDAPGLDLIEHEEEAEHEHEQEDGHEHEQGDGHEDDMGHHHGPIDPHIWLSPVNARVLVDAIAAELSKIDPDNAPDYAKNAKRAKQRISVLIKKIGDFSAEMKATPYLVQHDGFAYLARDFGLNEVGHVQTTPGREPGARHVAELLETIETQKVKCLFHETQFSPKLAQRLNQETKVSLREIDPLGIEVQMSERAYVRIIQGIILQMESCLYTRKSGTVSPVPTPNTQ